MRAQHPSVRRSVAGGMSRMEAFLIFRSPYPEDDPRTKHGVCLRELHDAALEVDPFIAQRIEMDPGYANPLLAHVCSRPLVV